MESESTRVGTDEAEWIARARDGDRGALDALIALHQARIFGFGMKMCRNPEDAKDVLQETLLAMARGIHRFRGASSLSTWLYTIARSHCIKRRRRGKFAPRHVTTLGEGDTVLDEGALPDEQLENRRIDGAITAAIGALDPMYREVLILRDVEGLSAPEVAEVLGIQVAAVKSRLHRARLAVRDHVAPLLGSDEPASSGGGRCPDVLRLFSEHLEGDVNAEKCAAMERHIEGCPKCRGACDSLRRTLSLCRTADRRVEVPDAVKESVRAAVRGLLSEKR